MRGMFKACFADLYESTGKSKKKTYMFPSNKRLTIISLCIASLLLLPLVAMQFTNEVKWTLSDFVAAGILLLVAGLVVEFILRKVKTTKFRIAACVALFLVFLLLWADLAVGIFGTPISGH
jgi:hypothetical protein